MIKKLSFLLPFIFIIQNVFGQANILYIDGGLFKIDSQAVVHVNGNLSISYGEPFTSYGSLNVRGDILDNGNLTTIRGKLRLIGNSPQTLDCLSFFNIDSVEFNNPNGFTLNKSLKINGECSFVSGIINPTIYSVTFGSDGYVSSTNPPSDSSHINGQVTKLGIGTFTYPVGDGTKYQKVRTDLSINDEGIHVTYMPTDAGAATFSNAGTDTTLLVWYNPSEHWLIKNEANVTGTVTLYWDGYRDSVKGGISDQRVAHQDGDWLNEGTNGTGSFSAGSVTSNILDYWSPFTIGSISAAVPLPLYLIRFDARAHQGYNQLDWETGVELNNMYFELERSNNAQQFSSITRVNAKGSGSNYYSYQDTDKWSGDVFYRLKMIEGNGHYVYSKVIRIAANEKSSATSFVYPNPSKGFIFLSLAQANLIGSKARLIDHKGVTLQVIDITRMLQTIDLTQYPNADYILSLDNGVTFHISKIE